MESSSDFKHSSGLATLLSHPALGTVIESFLTVNDLSELTHTNKELNTKLSQRRLHNKIYFLHFFKNTEMFSFDFYDSSQHKTYTANKIKETLCSLGQTSLGSMSLMNSIKTELQANLQLIVPPSTANRIVTDIQRNLTNPSFNLPHLRREGVGDYCNSSLQMMMTDNLYRQKYGLVEGPYKLLNVMLLETNQGVLEELKTNWDRLIAMRFYPENINDYSSTSSPFLNIINLVHALVDHHLESIKNYLEAQLHLQPFQFLTEFIQRYNTFRKSVVNFEEKLGFVMEMFSRMFNHLQPCFDFFPDTCLWRAFMRKWVSKMKPFQTKTSQGFTQLMVRLRERNMRDFILEGGKLESASYSSFSKYITVNTVSDQLYGIVSEQLEIIERNHPLQLESIVSYYTEYLIDTSVNEYSVRWNCSSVQKLGSIYNLNEEMLLESTQHLYSNWRSIISEGQFLKPTLQNDIERLRYIVKPVTLSKIICIANQVIKQTSSSTKLILGNFQKIDNRVRAMNQYEQNPVQLQENLKQFFDFDKAVRMEKIQQIIDSSEQMGIVESQKHEGLKVSTSSIQTQDPEPLEETQDLQTFKVVGEVSKL